jgi:hypothetical protein
MANKRRFIAFSTVATPSRCPSGRADKKEQRPRTVSSALATVLARRSGRSSALPYPPLERRDSTMPVPFCHWTVFHCENGRFFVVNF